MVFRVVVWAEIDSEPSPLYHYSNVWCVQVYEGFPMQIIGIIKTV